MRLKNIFLSKCRLKQVKKRRKKAKSDDRFEDDSLESKLTQNLSEVEAKVTEILGRNAGSKSTNNNNNVGAIIAQVLGAIKPLIVSSVAEAFERDAERFDEVCSRVTFLETENLILREHVEKLEQYSRRDQVKVYGVKHVANEDTDDLICKIGKEAGSDFSKNDISVSHRVPAHNGKLPAIVCKFTTRRVR